MSEQTACKKQEPANSFAHKIVRSFGIISFDLFTSKQISVVRNRRTKSNMIANMSDVVDTVQATICNLAQLNQISLCIKTKRCGKQMLQIGFV